MATPTSQTPYIFIQQIIIDNLPTDKPLDELKNITHNLLNDKIKEIKLLSKLNTTRSNRTSAKILRRLQRTKTY